MGDTTNWEFAAAVAAVSIGLGGLLLFTLVGTFSSWRMFARATEAANEAKNASLLVQDVARQMALRDAMQAPAIELSQATGDLSELRDRARELMEQQARLQDSVRGLVEVQVQRADGANAELQELEGAVKRLEEQVSRVALAVADLGGRGP